jgi:type IV pilus assembly protein PilM
MAHTVTGIDLGSWSVKFAVFDAGFRRAHLKQTFEVPVPAGEAPLAERQAQALAAGLPRLPAESTIHMGVPGEMLALRVLDLPFADARKIDQVVGYEMEGQIMHDLSEVVMDHIVLSAKDTAEGESPGSRALAVAARIDEVGTYLESLKAMRLDPRALYATPVIYHALLAEEDAPEDDAGCRVFLDVGHQRSQLCIVRGTETVFARTINHGGEELTQALITASGNQWTWTQAEQTKHTPSHGMVPSHTHPAATTAQRQVGQVLVDALAPLVRDLRQTLASFRAQNKTPVTMILLAGGGSRLQGLPEFLQEELDVPTKSWPLPPAAPAPDGSESADDIQVVDEEGAATRARFALSTALGWAGVRGNKELDLRRGPYQYRASYSVVRQKAGHLAMLGVAVLVCAAANGTIALRRVSSERTQLQARLSAATKELFGQERLDATEITAALKKSFRDEMAPVPKVTAYDLLDQISRQMPSAEQVAIDIQDLEIKAKKTTIKGTVDSAASVDDVVAKLKTIDCFDEISKGPVTEVTGGLKQFSLTINSKCP